MAPVIGLQAISVKNEKQLNGNETSDFHCRQVLNQYTILNYKIHDFIIFYTYLFSRKFLDISKSMLQDKNDP